MTFLTVLPQIATNFNIIIAAALFFYMAFASICALLAGRAIVRGSYYVWLLWSRRGRGTSAAIEVRARAALSALLGVARSPSVQPTAAQQQGAPAANGKEKVSFAEPFPVLTAFQRPFRRILKRAIIVSAGLCALYSHCWSRSLSGFDVSRDTGSVVCRAVFLPMLLFGSSDSQAVGAASSGCRDSPSCAEERSIWLLWTAAMIAQLFSYAINEFAGKHHRGYRDRSSSSCGGRRQDHATEIEASGSSGSSFDLSSSPSADSEEVDVDADEDGGRASNGSKRGSIGREERDDDAEGRDKWPLIHKFTATTRPEQPRETLAMVSWYSQIVFTTGFDMLLSFKVFLGRFDARKMEAALLGEARRGGSGSDPEGLFDFSRCRGCELPPEEKKGFWFDFVSDCGDGFNSSYQVSRLLAQPTLDVTQSPSASGRDEGTMRLPRGKLLINGGDLAYPDPTPESYERRFFRTFEDAMPPPPSFRREHISIRKPALPVQGWRVDGEKSAGDSGGGEDDDVLSNYGGPCCFLIPGNHDWFDGLKTFTRYILSRDWLGGWLMPQRTSYFALKLPRGWWLLGFDLALDDDIDVEQFNFFANVAASMRPDDSVIMVSHVPHWVLNEYENHSRDADKETHLSELVRTHLGGRVRLRLAGDLHHYTRHMPLSSKGPGQSPRIKEGNSGGPNPVLIVSGGGGAVSSWRASFNPVVLQRLPHECVFVSSRIRRTASKTKFKWGGMPTHESAHFPARRCRDT